MSAKVGEGVGGVVEGIGDVVEGVGAVVESVAEVGKAIGEVGEGGWGRSKGQVGVFVRRLHVRKGR